MSVDAAANALSQSEQKPTEPENAEAAQEPQAQETEQQTEAVETEVTEPEGQPEPEVELITVKVQGEEKQVTLEELRNGYMRNEDYSKNNASIRERDEALKAREAEVDALLADREESLSYELSRLESPELQELRETDPEAYLKEFTRVQTKFNKLQADKQKRQEKLQAEAEKRQEKENTLARQSIEGWLDDDAFAQGTQALAGYLSESKVAPELQGAIGSRHELMVLAHKAMQYDQLMSQDLSKKEVKAPPKTLKPAAPKDAADKAKADVSDMRATLKRTGNFRDAARLLSGN